MADKFLDFIDMIDGGGAGTMGDKFEGGGILSMLANALATPYGSEDDERMRRLRQMRGLLAPDEDMAPVPAATPAKRSGGMPAAQNYESTARQFLQMKQGPKDYRSQHIAEAVSDAYDREMSQAEALGISPEEAKARYIAQKHMAYPHLEMEYLTDPEDGYAGIPNIERLMPPTSAAPQAPQGIPMQPYQAKQIPPSLQLDPIPKYAETLDRMKQELGEERYNEILMSPNFVQILQMYERGGPMR